MTAFPRFQHVFKSDSTLSETSGLRLRPTPVILEFDREPDLGEAVLRKGFAEEIAKFHKTTNDQHYWRHFFESI